MVRKTGNLFFTSSTKRLYKNWIIYSTLNKHRNSMGGEVNLNYTFFVPFPQNFCGVIIRWANINFIEHNKIYSLHFVNLFISSRIAYYSRLHLHKNKYIKAWNRVFLKVYGAIRIKFNLVVKSFTYDAIDLIAYGNEFPDKVRKIYWCIFSSCHKLI